MLNLLLATLVACVLQGERPSTDSQPTASQKPESRVLHFNNASCPIMGKPVSTKLFAETEKGRIYICCKSCIKDIQDDVETAHRTAYPTIEPLQNKTCPVSGKPIEKDSLTVVLQGFEIRVCSKECVSKLRKDAQIHLVRLKNPKIVDLANTQCPVTGTPVQANTYCLIDNHLVRLSSSKCIEEVDRDPSGVLARAKELKDKAAPSATPPARDRR